MSDNKTKDSQKPIKPVRPSDQSGTPIRKMPEKNSIRPAKPSRQTGTSIPFGELEKGRQVTKEE